MITALVATLNHERQLGPLLSALVPGAVDGVLRQVIIADGGSSDATLEIARDAGADVLELTGPVETRLAAGYARAKGDWLLILDPLVVPPPGWELDARRHLADHPDRAAWFAPRAALLGGPPKHYGLLLSRRILDKAGGVQPGLHRRLGRLKRLSGWGGPAVR